MQADLSMYSHQMEGSTRFTACEGGARLAAAARARNTIAADLAAFTSTRLLYEEAHMIRGPFSSGVQRSVFVTRASRVPCVAYELRLLTDLSVVQAVEYGAGDWGSQLEENEVLVCTAAVLQQILEERTLEMARVNVLVVDSCHLVHSDLALQQIMEFYKSSPVKPRVLGLTYPLFTTKKHNPDGVATNEDEKEDVGKGVQNTELEECGSYENADDFEMYQKLEWNIEQLEEKLCCQMDLAEDIDGGKRFVSTTTKPKELIVEYSARRSVCQEYEELEGFMRSAAEDVQQFLEEHRYDPTEIYGEDLYEEFKNIPDPTIDPKLIFKQFLYVLDELGPYGADKAAFTLLTRLEKLKIKVPYERHFLLLCLCTTVLIKIRCRAEQIFSKYSDLERITTFSTPKVLRFIEMLSQFENPEDKETEKKSVEKNDGRDNEIDNECELNGDNENKTEKDSDKEVSDIPNEANANRNNNINNVTKSNKRISDNCIPNVPESEANVNNETKSTNNNDINNELKSKNSDNSNNHEPDANINNKTESNNNDDPNQDMSDESTNVTNKSTSTDNKSDESNSNINNKANSAHNSDNPNTKSNNKSKSKQMLADIDNCDFATLANRIEDRVNTYEANLKEIDIETPNVNSEVTDKVLDFEATNVKSEVTDKLGLDLEATNVKNEVTENLGLDLEPTNAKSENAEVKSDNTEKLGFPRRVPRTRGRVRPPRVRNPQALLNPDALCGIVFMNEPIMAKIMFLLVAELSRSGGGLAHVSAQYCAPGPRALPPADLRRHCRAREDALKKFRMHDCNLLLATSALEEGIDLPRCNFVLRWDVPASYRSHVLGRGRARAPRAACALLVRDDEESKSLLHHVAVYKELDQIIGRKCGCGIQDEPPQQEEDHADTFTALVLPYTPSDPDDVKTENEDQKDREKPVYKEERVGDIIKYDKDNGNKVRDTKMDKELDERVKDAQNEDRKDNEKPLYKEEQVDDIIKYDKDNDSEVRDTKIDKELDERVKDANKDEQDKDAIDEKKSHELGIEDRKDSRDEIDALTEKFSDIRTSDRIDSDTNLVCNKCGKKRTSVENACCVEKGDIDKEKKEDIASVDLSTAIALINRYCGKLPSDTFTRLAPSWKTERVAVRAETGRVDAWVCTLRLPLNCPVKYNIVGHPMPTRALARRMAALQACRVLHRSGELDDHLMPIGKENFSAELEGVCDLSPPDARPGTTKRRQYYYKRTARAFTDCEPIIDSTDEQLNANTDGHTDNTNTNVLYAIECALWCALPERYNTRGRRLHAPQHARQAVGVLMRRRTPDRLQIPAFPVYTRSGEVRVAVSPASGADTRLSPRRKELIMRFMRFVFSDVLRVRRRGMTLQSEGSTTNNYYVVPTIKVNNPDGSTRVDIDWSFLEQIYQYTEDKENAELEKPVLWPEEKDSGRTDGDESKLDDSKPESPTHKRKVKKMDNPLLKPGEVFVFDAEKYREAVVTPWYRNQDQPQFFLVAEICTNLTPDSEFPSDTHTSFRDYYKSKYGVTLTQPNQPLLDVDHTSARLNLLTPRYVNRKGVALPVSSERTRRAKRDRLDQKQILVPELCTVHPFAAPLWFATVALPCVLYRINALLIADEIRRGVARQLALGAARPRRARWPPLDFGWSLAEVLSADSDKNEKKKENEEEIKEEDESEPSSREKEEQNEKHENEPKEKTINDILQEKEDAESGFEIGTWDNNMASSIPEDYEDEFLEPLPPNLTFCTSASGGSNWCDPVQKPKTQFQPSKTFSMADSDCSYMSSDFDTDDSDLNSEDSDDTDTSGFCSSKSNAAMGVRIEYKTAHEAEAVDVERRAPRPAPQPDAADDAADRTAHAERLRAGTLPRECLERFQQTVAAHEQEITEHGLVVPASAPLPPLLPDAPKDRKPGPVTPDLMMSRFQELFPYKNEHLDFKGPVTLEDIEKNKRSLLNEFKESLSEEQIGEYTCFSMVDVDIDSPEYKNEKVCNIGFDTMDGYVEKANLGVKEFVPYYEDKGQNGKDFDFDYQPKLEGHPGPSPSVILQALTMSNANDGINLERLETIGDSFLKFAITAYLYCALPTVHEGKLSHMRSKQVSNLNLYRLGVRKRLGARMIASKFEPHDNWLPPCHRAPPAAHAPVDAEEATGAPQSGCFIPYNLITQHSIPDKSIADCVEALIGAYLLECGPRGALLFMSWLGIRVLPRHDVPLHDDTPLERDRQRKASAPKRRPRADSESSEDDDEDALPRPVGSLAPYQDEKGQWFLPMFGELKAPPSPLLRYVADPEGELEQMLSGYDALERTLHYRFKDRSLLLQAMTHASHQRNRLTDCYQRLEFLGDAILDYLITRHLYEDARRHSPGALTDLRSALVNNTIFATLAARHGFHKYFRHMSPGLNEVLTRYVRIQEENGHSISEEHYLIHEDELEQAEDVEVPKALGDLFESVAGAIFLDSGMSLGAVWRSYERLMGAELEAFSAAAPKSPVRELLEAEPDTAKFGKPERLADGRRVRVCVEVFGRGAFKGVGRNYRIAKGTAARCALRHLKRHRTH